ncbi:hypothetical protein L208DRAFT_1418551, partial [Tricholoma matsutake]
LVPTIPSMLQASTHTHHRAQHHHQQALGRRALEPQISLVPITTPPVDHMPHFPLSIEANVKVGLERLLEREKKAREVDGLEDGGVNISVRHSMKGEEDCSSDDCGDGDTNDDDDEPHSADDYWEAVLGIGKLLRRDTSQWDILASFLYRLGSTPQAVLDELWVALPSLCQLFNYDGGWNCVMKETWWRLFEAILEPDVLQFGISLLMAAALTDAIQGSLVQKYEYKAKWNVEMAQRLMDGDTKG